MREIVLDTETTGLDPNGGHRIVEIGCLELANHVPTGRSFHTYINPERSMPTDAFEVHGLSEAFLAGQPLFGDVAVEFLDFIDDALLVIHNARFDVGFLNSELKRVGRELLPESCSIDTVELARRKFPGAPANLDALCRRFGIDNAARTKHGALLDAEFLAEVYLELVGGRQPGLVFAGAEAAGATAVPIERSLREPRHHAPSDEELVAHAALVERLTNPVWHYEIGAAGT